MPLCDIISIKNKETQKGKPLEGAIKISDDNETEAKGLCKVFSPSDIVAFISADGSRQSNEQYKRLEFGGCSCPIKHKNQCKNILVMGQNNTRKNTFINRFANHVMGVEFQDDFRYQVILQDYEEYHKSDVIVYHIKQSDIRKG